MFSVHPVTAANQTEYRDQLDQYFKLRHDIYVEGRGWRELKRPDGREIDAFDTEQATHLLGITPDGEVVAGSRLVPTLAPHLMSEVFPELADGGVPRRADVFEWTRIFVVERLREPGRPSRASGMMYCAIQEYCLTRRVSQLSIVCEDCWHRRLSSFGWKPRRLGEPIKRDGAVIAGLIVEVSDRALMATRQFFGISGSALYTPLTPEFIAAPRRAQSA